MQGLQNVDVARQLSREREASLRRATAGVQPDRTPIRHWIGRQLVRTGTWLVNEQPMRPAPAR